MDFGQFNSRSGARRAFALHLRHPVTGERLWEREPVGSPGDADYDEGAKVVVLVRGAEDDGVAKARKEINQRRMTEPSGNRKERRASKAKGEAPQDDRSIVEFHGDTAESAIPLVAGFENVNRPDGAPLSADSEDDVRWFLNLQTMNLREDQQTFLEQVLEASSDRGNYLGNG